MREIRQAAVFCGSNTGAEIMYAERARTLGEALAAAGIGLVYGGTHKGLMGVLADAVLAEGGRATGIITARLYDKGHLHPGLDSHEIVPTMGARKARMGELADAFIALPGGIGTLEELLEAWTLNQLGEIDKPVGLLNINGFFDPFMHFIDHMVDQHFLPSSHRGSIVVEADPGILLEHLRRQPPVSESKWMN